MTALVYDTHGHPVPPMPEPLEPRKAWLADCGHDGFATGCSRDGCPRRRLREIMWEYGIGPGIGQPASWVSHGEPLRMT